MTTNQKLSRAKFEEMCSTLKPRQVPIYISDNDLTKEEALWFDLLKQISHFFGEEDIQVTPNQAGFYEPRVEAYKRNYLGNDRWQESR